jgi:hypothetical protein
MLQSKLTLQKLRSRGIEAELLYGGLEFFRMAMETCGADSVREMARYIKRATPRHHCEHALQLLVDLVAPVLEGHATWDEARQYLDKLTWEQNSN